MKKKTYKEQPLFDVEPIAEPHDDLPTSFDQLIKQELTKFDVVVPAVNELAKEFMPLKIISLDDAEGYAEVSKALRFIVSKRTAVEEKRKELKADSLTYGRAVDARAKEITAMLEPIESHLKAEKQRIDDEKERLEREEEEKKQRAKNLRIEALVNLGMFQTMTEFVWKSKLNPNQEESFPLINLELFDDDDFNAYVSELKNKIEAENKIILEREEKAKAESEELEREKKKIEEEKKRIEEEMNEMKSERAVGRNQKLAELGLGTVSYNPYWVYMKKMSGIDIVNIIHNDDVFNMNNAEWNETFENIKNRVEAIKIEEQEYLENDIKNRLAKEKEIIDKMEAEEKERKAGMSDKEIYLEYINQIKRVPVPELKTKKWQGYLQTINKTIDTFLNMN